MAKVYTRTGDAGQTSLYSGERVAKCCPRVDAYGEADELQAALGLARALSKNPDTKDALKELEETLVTAMAELATIGGDARITWDHVEHLENQIDAFQAKAPQEFRFVVPGDQPGSAALHLARTVARRCERALLLFAENDEVSKDILAFFNRISDLCYVLARYEDE